MSRRRRKHFKVDSLPPELVEAINKKLVDGWTYRELADWLNQQGQPVSKSAVGRYGRDFLARLEALKATQMKARAIVEAAPDAPATELSEAANQLATQLIIETLLQVDDLTGARITDLLKVLPHLEKAGVARERLKLEYRQKVDRAVQAIEETAKQKGLDPETLRIIKEQIYGIVDRPGNSAN